MQNVRLQPQNIQDMFVCILTNTLERGADGHGFTLESDEHRLFYMNHPVDVNDLESGPSFRPELYDKLIAHIKLVSGNNSQLLGKGKTSELSIEYEGEECKFLLEFFSSDSGEGVRGRRSF